MQGFPCLTTDTDDTSPAGHYELYLELDADSLG